MKEKNFLLKSCLTLFFYFLFTVLAFNVHVNAETQPYENNPNVPLTSNRCNEFTFDATGSIDPDNESLSNATFQRHRFAGVSDHSHDRGALPAFPH